MRPMGIEVDANEFISLQSRPYSCVDNMIKVILATFYFDLACKQVFCFPGKQYK